MHSETWSKADLHIHSNHSDGLARSPRSWTTSHEQDRPERSSRSPTTTPSRARCSPSPSKTCTASRSSWARRSRRVGPHHRPVPRASPIPPGMSPPRPSPRSTSRAASRSSRIRSRTAALRPARPQAFGKHRQRPRVPRPRGLQLVPYLVWANSVAAKMFAGGQGIAATGGSDAHVLQAIGTGHTLFRGTTAEDLRSAIENLETRASARPRRPAAWPCATRSRYPRSAASSRWNWERCKAR